MVNAKDILAEEDEEKILEQTTDKDLIKLMVCQNCTQLKKQGDKWFCEEYKKETQLKDHCSLWNENINKKKELETIYLNIKEILRRFIDTTEENFEILALWIIGTYFHDNFETYPYLFINAMKGSGKTRLLKLIKALSKEGDMLASLSEAVLFRTTGTLCIDEFENIGRREKNTLRELLNTAYKKGGKVKRMRKAKTPEGEQQVVEEFDTFRPIVMANISGIEEVLADRCITLVLEKSNHTLITRKVETFEFDPLIVSTLSLLKSSVALCKVYVSRKVYIEWNKYLDNRYTNIHTYTPYTNLQLYTKLYESEIDGRNLEISMPLLLIAEELGIFDKIVKILKDVIVEKKEQDITESRDVMLLDFISKQTPKEYYKVKELTHLFKGFISYEQEEGERNWLNNTWTGKALRRLNLVLRSRRLAEGTEVMLNIEKAIEKMKLFK